MTTTKIDLYKVYKEEYVTPKAPTLVKATRAKYLTIAGQGEPGGQIFSDKLGALYNVAYTLKMNKKFAGMDYKVCGLEGLWWGDRAAGNFLDEPRESWHWKLIIRTPDAIGARDVKETIEQLLAKGKPATVAEVKLEAIAEGSCVQMLHVGPYATESESISRMLAFAAERGYAPHGLHHEIYLSDPRRVPPQRMRTILRFPVRKTRTPELAPA